MSGRPSITEGDVREALNAVFQQFSHRELEKQNRRRRWQELLDAA